MITKIVDWFKGGFKQVQEDGLLDATTVVLFLGLMFALLLILFSIAAAIIAVVLIPIYVIFWCLHHFGVIGVIGLIALLT